VTRHGFMSFRFTGKVDVDDPAPLVLIGGPSPPRVINQSQGAVP
jgi:hypothetical protein